MWPSCPEEPSSLLSRNFEMMWGVMGVRVLHGHVQTSQILRKLLRVQSHRLKPPKTRRQAHVALMEERNRRIPR